MAVKLTIAQTAENGTVTVYGTTDYYCAPDGGPGPIQAHLHTADVKDLNHADAVALFLRVLEAAEAALDIQFYAPSRK